MTAGTAATSRHLEFNALAMMVTTASTSVLGIAFWAAAARFYTPAEVGRASATLSTATMLAAFASLNLGNVYARFLPGAGPRSRQFVMAGYGVTVVAAVLLGTGFLLLGPTTQMLVTPSDHVLFPVLVVVLTIFLLQDFVLVALRAAAWVTVENVAFAVVKLALLAFLAGATVSNGVVVAWAAPAAVAVGVIAPILYFRMLPNRQPLAGGTGGQPPGRGELGRFFAAEYATGVAANIVPVLLPLIVLTRLGPEANAYYAVPWMISTALNLLVWNVASSFLVEASHDERATAALIRRALRLSCAVGVGGSVAVIISAPWVLSVLGGAYAAEGTAVLQFMAAAAPFTVIITTYTTLARIRRRMAQVVVVQLATAAIVISLAFLLVDGLGITGMGVAYLAGEALVTAFVLVPLVRGYRHVSPVQRS